MKNNPKLYAKKYGRLLCCACAPSLMAGELAFLRPGLCKAIKKCYWCTYHNDISRQFKFLFTALNREEMPFLELQISMLIYLMTWVGLRKKTITE